MNGLMCSGKIGMVNTSYTTRKKTQKLVKKFPGWWYELELFCFWILKLRGPKLYSIDGELVLH
ncbi:Protein of unknown function [Pyronema omphalodes CBS 100304]|uniref:Uncharacterized protein n=1 Tax=Pyronema omphalodes (strain CBS 100304) TaxID=1076935 RepID=U4L3X2_PYROM|nr:Protein of unknown function [Pyronema omphalodes CBS 100304]